MQAEGCDRGPIVEHGSQSLLEFVTHTPASQMGKQKHLRESRLALGNGKVQFAGAFAKIRVPLLQPCTGLKETKASIGLLFRCFEANACYSSLASLDEIRA